MISNSFDILHTFKNHQLQIRDLWLLVIYKTPHIFNEIIILISLISTILFIKNLSQNNELLVILSHGISLGRILLIPIILSAIFGVFCISLNGSLAPYFLTRYKNIESKISGNQNLNLFVAPAGIFFSEQFEQQKRIVQVRSINISEKLLEKVTILVTDLDNNFIERIDAQEARLESGFYKINNASINGSYQIYGENKSQHLENMRMPTNLFIENLKDRFDPPKMIDLWKLPQVIKRFKQSGLGVSKYQLYYYKQLLKPISMVAMTLIACCFITLNNRNKKHYYSAGLALGLAFFFLKEIVIQFLVYSGMKPLIASIIPVITIILLASFVVLHFQEA